MVQKTVILRKRTSPKVVNVPNGRSFTSRWERISRKQLPINIKVKRQRTIGPRRNNRMIYLNQAAPTFKKIKKKKKKWNNRKIKADLRWVNQSGSGLVSNLAKAGLELGSKGYLFIGSFTRILFHTKI